MAGARTTLTTVLSMNNTKFKKGIKGSQKQLTGFQKQIKSMGGMIAGAFAIGAITSFGKSAFRALDTQRKAEAALLTALKGKEDVQRNLIAQAKELQKLTLFGDEETIRAQSLIAAFVKEEATIKQLIPLVQDFATAKSMDLAGAADLVSKTIGSTTNAMTRYGITVTGAVGSAERLETLTRGLSDAFAGQAVAAAEADVSLTQLSNKWGDFKEGAAGFTLAMLGTHKVLGDINTAMKSEYITTWDKFLGIFSPQKMAEISAIAGAIKEVQSVTPGGAAGFDFGPGGGGGVTTGVASVNAMGPDPVLEEDFMAMSIVTETWSEKVARLKEEMWMFKHILGLTSDEITTSFDPAVNAIIIGQFNFSEAILKANEGLQKQKQLLEDMNAMMERFAEEGIVAVSAGLGELAVTGDLEGFLNKMLSTLGNFMVQFGSMLVAYGIAWSAFQNASMNPYVAIAAGIALAAIGGAMIGMSKNFSMGGGGGGSNYYGSGQQTFRVEGKDLVTVLDRQTSSNYMNT